MWLDLIPPLVEKFNLLRFEVPSYIKGGPQQVELLNAYESLSFEMVEGIQTLFLEMIRNQAYVRKQDRFMELEIYREAHLSMIASVEECLDESVASLPDLYFHLQNVIKGLRGYCVLLRQDIKRSMRANAHLEHDRRFRQINLQASQALESIDRLMQKCNEVARQMSANNLDIRKMELNIREAEALLQEAHYSEEEKALLAELLKST